MNDLILVYPDGFTGMMVLWIFALTLIEENIQHGFQKEILEGPYKKHVLCFHVKYSLDIAGDG